MRKITIAIPCVIIAFAIIVPFGFFGLYEHSYIKVDSVNSSRDYTLSVNFTAHSSTSTYFNPNYIRFNTTTYVDRGTANQSTLSLNNLVMEFHGNSCYTVFGLTTVSGNFSWNILPRSMNFVVGVENFTPVNNNFKLYTQFKLYGHGDNMFSQNNTTINSRLATLGSLFECNVDNFTSNIPVLLENSVNFSHNVGERYHFSLRLAIFMDIYPNTAVPKPFNFFVNTSFPGYTVPVYNSVDTRIVDNATRDI